MGGEGGRERWQVGGGGKEGGRDGKRGTEMEGGKEEGTKGREGRRGERIEKNGRGTTTCFPSA